MAELIGDRQARSPSEIIVKTLAIATTTGIAAGHLTTLRRISRRDSAGAIIAVFGFFILPALPFACLLLNSWHAFLLLLKQKKFDPVFYLSAALGVRATEIGADEDAILSVPLLRADYVQLVRRRNRYDFRWFGRLIVLLLFAGQAFMTVILAKRRSEYGDGSAFASWDNYNGQLAIGGIGTVISSISVTVLNISWQITELPRTRDNSRTFSKVAMAILDVGDASDAAVELRMAIVLVFLIPIAVRPESRSQLENIVFPNWLGVEPSSRWRTVRPGYPSIPDNRAIKLALQTTIIGLLVTPILFLLVGCVSWMSRLKTFVHLRQGSSIVLAILRAFKNVLILLVFLCSAYWVVADIINLNIHRKRGQWLEIMWIDPWAEILYVF